jgi:cobalt-zinc-cadmium efflux system membrane fusion protein
MKPSVKRSSWIGAAHSPRLTWAACIFTACALVHGCRRTEEPSSGPSSARPPSSQTRNADSITLSEEQIRNAGIVVQEITAESWKPYMNIPVQFVADPKHVAKVGPRMAGRVTNIHVELGDHVRRGQILLEMDTVEFHKTSMEYLVALARAEETQLALNRAIKAVQSGVGTEAEKERATANARAADAQMKEAEEHLHALGLSDRDIARIRTKSTHGQEHTHVVAPMNGRVISVEVTLGKVVSGTEELLTISDTSELWAVLRVYERDLAAIRVGTPVTLSTTAFANVPISATIDFISDVLEPTTRTVEARARVRNEALKAQQIELRPGMTGRATIALLHGQKSVMLPYESVQIIEAEPSVFVQRPDGSFQRKAVTVGSEYAGLIPVYTGIAPSDRVVVRGSLALAGELDKRRVQAQPTD